MRSQGPYEIDDSPDRVDPDAVWQFLSAEAYWSRWRSRDDVQRQIQGAWRVVGCYDGQGHMVGFARALSDGVALAYLADVYVLENHRGRGLGRALLQEMIEDRPGTRGLRPADSSQHGDPCLSILYSIRCYVKVLRDSPGGHETA